MPRQFDKLTVNHTVINRHRTLKGGQSWALGYHEPYSINIWLREYSDQLVRPELGLLRRSLRLLDDAFLTRPPVSKEQLTDDYREYWDTLKTTYERLVSSIPHRFAAVLDGFLSTPPVNLDGVVSVLANLVPSNFDHGVMWIDESGYGGWLSSPFQTGSGIDPVATLSALEVIAGSPNVNELTDKARARLLHAFDFGLASLENTVASASTDTTTWMTALHKDKELSERWPLGLMCRFVMAFYFIEQHLARENALAQLDKTKANIFRDRARVLMAIMYTALIVKVFRTVVEVRSPPYEAVPVALVSGNEISHWPGLDTGLVAVALLKGWEVYDWRQAINSFEVLRDVHHRICPPCFYPDGIPPRILPLFCTVMSLLKQQVVSHHNKDAVNKRFVFRGRPNSDNGDFLLGAFLANTGLAPGREFNPTVYLWATAHALSALVNWRKCVDDETTWAAKELDCIKEDHRNEMMPFRIFAPFGKRETLLWPTIGVVSVSLVTSLLVVLHSVLLSSSLGLSAGYHALLYYTLLVVVSLPPVVWYLWLLQVLRNRAQRVEGARADDSKLILVTFSVIAVHITALPFVAMSLLVFERQLISWPIYTALVIIIVGLIVWRFGRKDIVDRLTLALKESGKLLFGDRNYDWKGAEKRCATIRKRVDD